jgi:hypothetical protein
VARPASAKKATKKRVAAKAAKPKKAVQVISPKAYLCLAGD